MKIELRPELRAFVDEIIERLGQNMTWEPNWTEQYKALNSDDRIAVWAAVSEGGSKDIERIKVVYYNIVHLLLEACREKFTMSN